MSTYKIDMIGEIGWNVNHYDIQQKLKEANGDDVEINLSSSGGSIFTGMDISNELKAYKKNFPNAELILNIKGIAASMGSYIAANEVFSLVTIEPDSTHMRHNPLMYVGGDFQEMEKAASFLKRLANLFAGIYAKKSKKKIDEEQKEMNAETWLFGQEIIDAGYADEMIKTDSEIDRNSAIASAEIKFKAVMEKVKKTEMKSSEIDKLAAMFIENTNIESQTYTIENINKQKPAMSGKNKGDKILKNIAELKTEFPDVHAEAEKTFMQAGINQEKERVKSLLEMKKRKDFEGITKILDRVDEGIEKGESMQTVELGIMALLKKADVLASMDSNDIGNLSASGNVQTVSGEKEKEALATKMKMNEEN